MKKAQLEERESIRRESMGLREAGLALEPLDFTEKRRVLVLLCDRFCIDPGKLGAVNRDSSVSTR